METNRRAVAGGARVRADRHRRLRRRPLLRRLRRVRQGRPGGHPDPGHRPQPRAGGGPAPPAADALVPQHLVVGRRSAEAQPPREADGAIRRLAPGAGRLHALLRRRARAAVHRERDQRPAPLGPAERFALRQGRLPPVRRRRETARRSIRRRPARRPRRATSSTCPRAARRSSACGSVRRLPAQRRQPRSATASTRRFAARLADADEFYDRITPPLAERGRAAGPPPGARRDALDEAVLPLRRGHVAQGARGAPARRGRKAEGAERRVVPHVQRRHHLHARQVGVPLVRRLGPGVPHDRARRSSTSTSPRSSSC